jgi:hypothetical protein
MHLFKVSEYFVKSITTALAVILRMIVLLLVMVGVERVDIRQDNIP